MTTRLLTFLIWALLAASAAFWALRALASPAPVPEGVRTPAIKVAQGGSLEPLLGAAPAPEEDMDEDEDEQAPTETDSRFQLLGVVAPPGPESRQGGVALIAVDGKPARAWRTGALVANEMVLRSVSRRGATLVPQAGGTPIILSLPDVAAARGNTMMPGQHGMSGAYAKPGLPGGRPGMGQPAVGAGPMGEPPPDEDMGEEEEE